MWIEFSQRMSTHLFEDLYVLKFVFKLTGGGVTAIEIEIIIKLFHNLFNTGSYVPFW